MKMANKTMFKSVSGTKKGKIADTVNLAGGKAYAFEDEHALAQYVMTGTFNDTYYADGSVQLEQITELCKGVDDMFIAKCAVFARKEGYMKDTPAFLCAILANKNVELLKKIFPMVIDNSKMLRNFVQIIRSGQTGRKSFGYAVKKLIVNWLNNHNTDRLFRDSLGQSPSMSDIIKMVHPKPKDELHDAYYGYTIGKEVDITKCHKLIQNYELFKKGETNEIPDLDFRMLQVVRNDDDMWRKAFENGNWHFTRMNINNALKHGLFEDKNMVKIVSERLSNKELIAKSKVFPYQLMGTYMNINDEVTVKKDSKEITYRLPNAIKKALHNAMEIATENVPDMDGKRVVLCPDVSGSMSSSATGYRQGSTSVVRCIDIAGLVASVYLRKNENSIVLPFEGHVVGHCKLDASDTIMTNAKKLASIGGGSTNCSAPMQMLNNQKISADVVIYISDNESWVESVGGYWGNRTNTSLLSEWDKFKQNNPEAKMICIDITPNGTTQAKNRSDIMNVGGFSDVVFDIINDFVTGNKDQWVDKIKAIDI